MKPPFAGPEGDNVRWDRLRLRKAAAAILQAGLDAADPTRLVRRHLRLDDRYLHVAGIRHRLGRGRIVVVAAGKAAGSMALAAEQVLEERLDEALAVGVTEPPGLVRTRFRVASHPVPDVRGLEAACEVEQLVGGLGKDDLLLLLISGGASALLPAPATGISLAHKARVASLLMRAGTTIAELNTVRKHLSRLKGGGLARAAAPATVACLVLSDVVGDDLSTIASGPTVPDPSTYADAVEVLRRRGVWPRVPAPVKSYLQAGVRGKKAETPKPGDPIFRRMAARVIGSNRWTVERAAQEARRQGLRPLVLTTFLEGEARQVARTLGAILRECIETGSPAMPPVCLLAGGETTVTVAGHGRGGRNQEIALAAAELLPDLPAHAVVASLATDGIDGATEAAGGIVDNETVAQAQALGLASPAAFLAENDSYSFLGPIGDLIVTGPTGTNVVDLTLLLAGSPRPIRGRR